MTFLEKPLITVLMPCYNAMPYLQEALESIINQTYTNLEILCINDGSTDETGDVLEKYALQDNRIIVVHNKENIKLIRTLNKGIELANGEYIARMDADDIATLNRIEVELNYMLLNPTVDIVSCGSWIISGSGKIISKKIPRKSSAVACFFASFFYVPIGHPELLIKTSVLKNNHYLNEPHVLHTEDYELWSRLLLKGYNLQNISDLLHYFRINSQSVSRKFTEIQDNNFIECVRQHYIKYTNINHSVEIVRVLANRIDKNTTFFNFKKGLKEMQHFKIFFIKKENVIDKMILKEIQVVFYTHLFDICFQVIKKCSFLNKLYSVWILLINIHGIFYKGVITYLKNKII